MTKALHNQTFLDLAVQENGSVESLFDIALANDISITDDVIIGKEYNCQSKVQDIDILNYYKSNGIQPATAISSVNEDGESVEPIKDCSGIGCWAIGVDFVVS